MHGISRSTMTRHSPKTKSLLRNITVTEIYLIEFNTIVEKLAIYEAGTLA